MKYSIDTYPLYKDEKRFAFVVRAKMRMTEPVEVDVLRAAANKAIKRYLSASCRFWIMINISMPSGK